MTDLLSHQGTSSKWTRGTTSGDKTKQGDQLLGLQRQAGNKATGGLVGKKKKASASSDRATSAFEKIAPAIDAIAPTAGSSGAITAELKIPVKGAFVGIRVATTVSRGDDNTVLLGAEANVTAGATIGVAHAKFELGAYLEVQGGDARQALVILSWVLYRQLAESNAPREIEQAWFGDKKTKTSAEQWDARVRKTLFAKDSGNWAEVGVQVGGGAKGGIGKLKGEVSGKLRSGRLYDSESIERRTGAKSKTQKFTSKLGIDRGAQASLGDRIFSVIGAVKFTVPGASGSLQATVAVRQVKDKRKGSKSTTYELDSIEVDGTASCVGMDKLASLGGGALAIKNLLSKVSDESSKATANAEKELKSKSQEASEVIGDLDSFRDGLSTASQAVGGASLDIPGLSASGQIHIIGGYKTKGPFLTVLFEKLTSVTIDAGVFSLSAVKTERLASIQYQQGKWVGHLGELEKELGKKKGSTSGGGKGTTSGSKPGGTGTGSGGGGKGGKP